MNWKRNRLRVLRAERRMAQRELAARLSVTQSAVSLWESGEMEPTLERKRDLARALGVPQKALVPEEAKAS